MRPGAKDHSQRSSRRPRPLSPSASGKVTCPPTVWGCHLKGGNSSRCLRLDPFEGVPHGAPIAVACMGNLLPPPVTICGETRQRFGVGGEPPGRPEHPYVLSRVQTHAIRLF